MLLLCAFILWPRDEEITNLTSVSYFYFKSVTKDLVLTHLSIHCVLSRFSRCRSRSRCLSCHDTVMLMQVAVDEVLAEDGSLSLGVITNPHPGLVVTMFITGLKDSVIIEPDCVFHQKSRVGFHGNT